MRAKVFVTLILLLTSAFTRADDDPVQDAREAAAQSAAERAEEKLEERAERSMADAEAKYEAELVRDKRKLLGKAATDKSDADINRLYDEKANAAAEAAEDAGLNTQKVMRDRRANEQMKAATGKSMQEFMEMSPEEQQEWAAELQEEQMEDGE